MVNLHKRGDAVTTVLPSAACDLIHHLPGRRWRIVRVAL